MAPTRLKNRRKAGDGDVQNNASGAASSPETVAIQPTEAAASTTEEGRRQPRAIGAGALILLQASSRLLTLVMAQIQVRLAAAEAFGAAHIHLELLLGVILMFSREGVRNALVRQAVQKGLQKNGRVEKMEAARERAIANVALLPVIVGAAMTTVVMGTYARYLAPTKLVDHPDFSTACTAFGMGAMLELLAEPLYTYSMRRARLGPRVAAEMLGLFAKSVSTLGIMIWLQRAGGGIGSSTAMAAHSLLPFAIGQLLYGLSFLTVFVVQTTRTEGVSTILDAYLPSRRAASDAWLDPSSLRLALSMTRQNIVKHVLGEADKFAVTKVATLREQGAYALASNYASLVARLLYQPLEESARLTFATTLGSFSDEDRYLSSNDNGEQKKATMKADDLLLALSKFYVLLSCYLFVFCRPFTTPVLFIVAGEKWALQTSAPRILAAYGTAYLPVMAFNGLLEGFVQATASAKQLARYDGILLAASMLFLCSLAGLQLGPAYLGYSPIAPEVALVFASSISAAFRALDCFRFATRFFVERVDGETMRKAGKTARLSLRSIMPSNGFLRLLAVTAAFLHYHMAFKSDRLWHSPWTRTEYGTLIMLMLSVIIMTLQLCVIQSDRERKRHESGGAWQLHTDLV